MIELLGGGRQRFLNHEQRAEQSRLWSEQDQRLNTDLISR
jgi:hypothetical protein